jgi:uncharacterized protein (DUF488 family)
MILTVGHSTHTADAFLELLKVHGAEQLADVRSAPTSTRHPHFDKAALQAFLEPRGIVYRHFPALGGHRTPRRDSINTAWRERGFRGYADHMQTDAFRAALGALLAFAEAGRTAVMCAEAAWWQCHRRLLGDSLLVRGVPVRHILTRAAAKPHELSEFAREHQGGVIYPGLL